MASRAWVKERLSLLESESPPRGPALLIYHRVGAGSRDELDVSLSQFRQQLSALERHDVLPLDTALDRVEARDDRASVVLTFDDGFADVYENAWPLLRERRLPFTLYLATAFMGRRMQWEGSTAQGPHGEGMTWSQIEELVESGLCTIGNHTHNHLRPEVLTVEDIDECTETVERHLGVSPRHFTYPWGIPVPELEPDLARRFRSSSTGVLGRNDPQTHSMRLRRVPVRHSDPIEFFEAKLTGRLRAERLYAGLVAGAKMPARLSRLLPGRAG
ncbi:polysaccharide deacetylase family protein [Nostocoides sp. F2B08]|uniref:polysaccharide deacetylase family protein n=1 Tax=Nostocoides sp. F2B08 TaxID=2653936 RepID=UPI001D057543|nr:polysaccharide deacetylase family protein [Tetrasphaera sp. F2B08]